MVEFIVDHDHSYFMPYKKDEKKKCVTADKIKRSSLKSVISKRLLCSLCGENNAVMEPCFGISFCETCMHKIFIKTKKNSKNPEYMGKENSLETLTTERLSSNIENKYQNKTRGTETKISTIANEEDQFTVDEISKNDITSNSAISDRLLKSVKKVQYYTDINLSESKGPKIDLSMLVTTYHAKKGDTAIFNVNYTATGIPKVEWFLNGNFLKPSRKIKSIHDDSSTSLTIKQINISDVGIYTVRISDKNGEDSVKLWLIMNALHSEDVPNFRFRSIRNSLELYKRIGNIQKVLIKSKKNNNCPNYMEENTSSKTFTPEVKYKFRDRTSHEKTEKSTVTNSTDIDKDINSNILIKSHVDQNPCSRKKNSTSTALVSDRILRNVKNIQYFPPRRRKLTTMNSSNTQNFHRSVRNSIELYRSIKNLRKTLMKSKENQEYPVCIGKKTSLRIIIPNIFSSKTSNNFQNVIDYEESKKSTATIHTDKASKNNIENILVGSIERNARNNDMTCRTSVSSRVLRCIKPVQYFPPKQSCGRRTTNSNNKISSNIRFRSTRNSLELL